MTMVDRLGQAVSYTQAIHLISRGREAAVAAAEAAWAAFCDEDRLDAALRAARMRGRSS